MENLIDYFSNIPSSHRSLILVGGIMLFWLIENAFPLFRFGYKKMNHAGINIFFTITTIIVNFLLAFILLKASDWAVAHQFGILQWLPAMPTWAFLIIGLLVLDLIGAYFIHWLEHRVKWMWKFHLVHHSDTSVDTTTANRHHPGESVFRFILTTIAVFVSGSPMWLVMLYQSLSIVLSQFNHANIVLPKGLDSILSYVIVTPNMHHVHHHYVLPQTDTNYGNIFAMWDRIFGTFAVMDNKDIRYGIDTHQDSAEHSQIGTMLKVPFGGYRSPVGAKFDE